MPGKRRDAAICDANVLIDYLEADEDILRELVVYWGTVYVPTCVLHEVKTLSYERAEALGLTIIETPLELPSTPGLSGPDRACLYFAVSDRWVCITNDRLLRRECNRHECRVVWGLEMLILLVTDGQITKARAKGIAEQIAMINPEICNSLFESFCEKLESIKPE